MQPQAQKNNAQITPTFVNGSVYDPMLLCLDKEEFRFVGMVPILKILLDHSFSNL